MDPVEKLKKLGIHALQFVAVEKEKQSMCVAILANSGMKQGNRKEIDLVVHTQPFRVSEGILAIETSARIVHQSLPTDLNGLGTSFAYLCNVGLDMKDVQGIHKSFMFEHSGELPYRLGFGDKFRLPLVCVKLEDIKSESKNLNALLGEDTKLFSRYLKNSSFPDILSLPGNYTAIVPADNVLIKLFGKEIPDKTIVDTVVLKSLVSGTGFATERDEKGKEHLDSRVDMLGEPIIFKKGVPFLGNHTVEVLRKEKFSNGIGMIIRAGDFSKIPDSSSLKQAQSIYQKLVEKYQTLLTVEDLHSSIQRLEERVSEIVGKEMKEFLKNIETVRSWAKRIEENSESGKISMKDAGESLAISTTMLPFFKQIRDQ